MGASDVLKQMYGDGFLVFGHRGAQAYAPMNTLVAFELAAAQGAQGIELDVHFSSDGELIVIHDYTVDGTSNGSGEVARMSLDELKSLDAGSYFDPKFSGTRIPTLDEVFEAVGQALTINVEIKVYDLEEAIIEQAVADCITRNNMQERVIVSSFAPNNLRRFRKIAPHIPLGYLTSPETFAGDTQALLSPADYDAEHWHFSMIGTPQMVYARDAGKFVNTWTINDVTRARQLRLLGVQGFITDTPDVILKALS